jgi:hypothetical protein
MRKMNKKTISPKGNYKVPDCVVTNLAMREILCQSFGSNQLEDADTKDWGTL